MPRKSEPCVRPRLRVTRGDEILLGPGKADLLAAIDQSGSLREAALELDMSYMRAWSLVRTMNGAFRAPLVTRSRGGARHGSAQLTPLGRRVLALYREMEAASIEAIAGPWRKIRRELK